MASVRNLQRTGPAESCTLLNVNVVVFERQVAIEDCGAAGLERQEKFVGNLNGRVGAGVDLHRSADIGGARCLIDRRVLQLERRSRKKVETEAVGEYPVVVDGPYFA